jgi:solute carrier family 8 (sodium/calcium exchanger)
VSIAAIGIVTAVIGDIASQLGCYINLKDTVNAITFVALGTSVPDTFASKLAAIQVCRVLQHPVPQNPVKELAKPDLS